ncbi:hypothetical protein [Spirosoma litoris]
MDNPLMAICLQTAQTVSPESAHRLLTPRYMYLTENVLTFLLATVATLVATLTGLIGAFSTFRLQESNREINLLKNLVLRKPVGTNQVLVDVIKANTYESLEKVYDRNLASVELLHQAIVDGTPSAYQAELLADIDNIRRNQVIHDQKKYLTLRGFQTSLAFVFITLLLLALTNWLLLLGSYLWPSLGGYLVAVGYCLWLFTDQLKKLMA